MRVLIAGDFPEETKEKIRGHFPADWQVRILPPQEATGALAEAQVLIPEHMQLGEALLAAASRLRLVQTGAGHDNVDLEACSRHGVAVCCAPGVNARAVAEHVLACILCHYKNLIPLDAGLKAGLEAGELRYAGGELAGKTIGILGLGHVGRELAALCGAFQMRVLGCSRRQTPIPGVELRSLEQVCRESDILSLHVPLTGETRHLIDRRLLDSMKPGALLVNTSRGAVVDEAALICALRHGQLGGACLDVFEEEPLPKDSPLRKMKNVILTPHTAGLPDGVRYHKKRYAFFAENIRRYWTGQTPEGLLNPGAELRAPAGSEEGD